MKHPFTEFVINFVVIFSLSLFLFSNIGFTTALQNTENSLLPVENLLKPDGTLDLSAGYIGSLDISNFEVSIDPSLGPIFKPLAASKTWNSLGSLPLNNVVYAVVINGSEVYVGGDFLNAGGMENADYIAKFNGSNWSALGASPLNNAVYDIAINGTDLYAGGAFTNAGGIVEADYIAMFNGSSWSALGSSSINNWIYVIAVNDSDVYAGGVFTDAGGILEADYIAKFSGGTWSALGTTPLNNWVKFITIASTDVYVGGAFTNAGGILEADYIAKFSDGNWSALGTIPLNNWVYAINIIGEDVYAGGVFTDAGGVLEADYIARFSGSSWSALGTTPLNDYVSAIANNGSEIYAAGNFTNAGGDMYADYIAKFSGGNWSALSTSPLTDTVFALNLGGEDVYAGGLFKNAGGDVNADYIAYFGLQRTYLVNSILPVSRTGTIGNTVTVYNSIINVSNITSAANVTISMNPAPAGTFSYTQTNCATNAVIGSPNAAVDIPAGGLACYVLSFTPSASFPATQVHIQAQASNVFGTSLLPGINTWLLRATASAGPDVIALTTTTDFHQLACSGANTFAVALSNVGAAASGDITVSANTGAVSLPLSISIQETNPGTGAIIGDNVLNNLGAGENGTVAVFVTFNGCINFDPAANRIFIEFRDASNNIVGSTSTAVSTNR